MSVKEEFNIYAISTDPIYIGTGGYTIGRVDNTIVRDPITRIPKIPGTSVAGTWRYYMTLTLQWFYKEKFEKINEILNKGDRDKIETKDVRELVNRLADKDLNENKKDEFSERKVKFKGYAKTIKDVLEEELNKQQNNEKFSYIQWKLYWGNLISSIKCAGQDDKPNDDIESTELKELDDIGHCGHCIVCKTFGFSKNKKSQQGLAYFSDLNILFFPVSTRFGVRWITSPYIIRETGLGEIDDFSDNKIKIVNSADNYKFLNLGWLNFEVDENKLDGGIDTSNLNEEIRNIIKNKIVVVSDNTISQIINANLEVRTSVSIDPLTGAAREGALFTSETIPRGTVFYGNVRIMDRLEEDEEINSYLIRQALEESKIYYESFGIGGLVTRGFGRLKVYFKEPKDLPQDK